MNKEARHEVTDLLSEAYKASAEAKDSEHHKSVALLTSNARVLMYGIPNRSESFYTKRVAKAHDYVRGAMALVEAEALEPLMKAESLLAEALAGEPAE